MKIEDLLWSICCEAEDIPLGQAIKEDLEFQSEDMAQQVHSIFLQSKLDQTQPVESTLNAYSLVYKFIETLQKK